MAELAIARGAADPTPRHGVSLREAFRVWLRVALLSFGGPAGQIAVMHRILVEEKRWISEARFLHALNYCMLLPGPEAQQLATYIGWLMHRTLGGIMAGGLFVLPGIIAIMALSYVYAGYGNVPVVVGAVLRAQGRGARDRARGGGPHRQARAQEQRDACARGGRLRRHLLLRRAVSVIIFGAALIGFVGASDRRPAAFQAGSGHGSGKASRRVATACSARSCPSTPGRRVARALAGRRRSGSRSGSCR